jgi:hypothetical protein
MGLDYENLVDPTLLKNWHFRAIINIT